MDNGGYDAIVLAGGGARRLGGAPKPQLLVGGTTLLDRVLDAVSGAATVVVVGPEQPAALPVRWVQEDPPGSGPVAALAAALPLTAAPAVVVLAADLPWIAGAVGPLLRTLDITGTGPDAPPPDVALLGTHRPNYLAAAWRRSSLSAALTRLGPPQNAAMRSLVEGLEVARLIDADGWGADCDTWEDLAAARDRSG